MQICYVDESGDTRDLTSARATCTPVCVIGGVLLDQNVLKNLTHEFLNLKRTTHPHLGPRGQHSRMRWVLSEIKGADLRRSLRADASRRNRRHAIHFLDKLVALLEDYDAKLVGRVWIKGIGSRCDDIALYGYSMQAICSYFNHYLDGLDQFGVVIADSRTPTANSSVAHSIFTQKFKLHGDEYDRVLEMPTFGDSRNHVGIQIVDLVCSALLFPMATYAYCLNHVYNVHVDDGFSRVAARYGPRIQALQYRFNDGDRYRGGITVDDKIGARSGSRLFRPQ